MQFHTHVSVYIEGLGKCVVPTRAPYELLHYDTGYPLEVSTLRLGHP